MSQQDVNESLAQLQTDVDENTMEGKYLTFQLGGEVYGLPIEYIIEIIGVQRITKVPDMEKYVKGVINLRGQVIPVIDVRNRFGMEKRDYDDRTCIMVTQNKGVSIGLIVDTVEEVKDIPEETISEAPAVATSQSGEYIKGISQGTGEDGQVVIIMNLQKLLYAGVETADEDEKTIN